MKFRKDNIWFYIFILLVGFLLGAMLIYRIELNTINQAFDSLEYCYQTYALK